MQRGREGRRERGCEGRKGCVGKENMKEEIRREGGKEGGLEGRREGNVKKGRELLLSA